MNEVKIIPSQPSVAVSRQLDGPQKIEKQVVENETLNDQFLFSTVLSVEETDRTIAYRKVNPETSRLSEPAPTSENWIG